MAVDVLRVRIVSSLIMGSALTATAFFLSGGRAELAAPGFILALLFFARAAYLGRRRSRLARLERAIAAFTDEDRELVRDVARDLGETRSLAEIDRRLVDRGVAEQQRRAAIAFAAVELRRRELFVAQIAAARVKFEGGDGASADAAVVCRGAPSTTALDFARTRFITTALGPEGEAWEREGLEERVEAGARYDVVAVRDLKNETARTFWFEAPELER